MSHLPREICDSEEAIAISIRLANCIDAMRPIEWESIASGIDAPHGHSEWFRLEALLVLADDFRFVLGDRYEEFERRYSEAQGQSAEDEPPKVAAILSAMLKAAPLEGCHRGEAHAENDVSR